MIRALCLGLCLSACASVQTARTIPAPADDIWAVLVDAPGYAAWNPVLIQAKGDLVNGETVGYRVRQSGGRDYDIEATIVERVPGRRLVQRGGTWGVLTFEHTWRLESAEGGTRVTQTEEYGGIGVWFWDRDWVEPAYAKVSEALEARVRQRGQQAAVTPR